MALPDLSLARAWVESQGAPRRRRTRFRAEGRLAAREVWTYISMLALNFEYVGRGDRGLWAHSATLHLAQKTVYNTNIATSTASWNSR